MLPYQKYVRKTSSKNTTVAIKNWIKFQCCRDFTIDLTKLILFA